MISLPHCPSKRPATARSFVPVYRPTSKKRKDDLAGDPLTGLGARELGWVPFVARLAMLSARIRTSLANYGRRTVIEEAGGQWRLDGDQLLGAASFLLEVLAPYTGRPLIAYLQKGPLYYAFLACSFLNRLDFCPVDIDNPIQRVFDIADQLSGSVIVCDGDEALARLRKHTERCLKVEISFPGVERKQAKDVPGRDASYYIATSGSTGVPKLVQVPHDRTIAFLDWAIPFYEIDDSSRWGQFSSIGFDLSLVDFLAVICGGGTLISLSAQMDRIRPAKAAARPLSRAHRCRSV